MTELESWIRVVMASADRAVRRAGGGDLGALPAAPAPTPHTRSGDLATALGLTDNELALVWSIVARAIEPSVAIAARLVFGTDARAGVSLAHHIAWRELSVDASRELLAVLDPGHPLRASGIVFPIGDEPFVVSTPLTTTQRVCRYLGGDDALDPIVESNGGTITVGSVRHSPEQERVLDELRALAGAATGATIVLEGIAGSGRRTAAAIAVAPRRAIAMDFSRIAVAEAMTALAALRRDALLADGVPVLAELDDLFARLPPDDDRRHALVAALDALRGPVVITSSTPGVELRPMRRMVVRKRWPLPDAATRRELWLDAISDLDPVALDTIAHRYRLGAGGIAAASRAALHHAVARPSLDDVVVGIQDNIAEKLGELARRVDVTQDWSELVLPVETFDDVRALIGRVRNAHTVLDGWGFRRKLARGAGVAALFSGPPGTGKTMVAGLIARELQLELYQVDLSRIVSKWVGETEKQLAKVFEAAEAGHALLLFDEADALFAKRSAEVKSAVDRYANLEVNYLLQRVESFGGVVILTTNLDTSIDPALRRRLATHIVFGPPELAERISLWRTMLDTNAPIAAGIDFRALAEEFREMTGANIRNAALTAAFIAAEEGGPISESHLRRAARSEYRAMGRMLGGDASL